MATWAGRVIGRLAAAFVALAVAWSASAAAGADAALTGFRHVQWGMAGGAPSRINAITQSTDGFLWIGGVEGLVRFDGVTFEPVAATKVLRHRLVVSALFAAPDGPVWAGLARGRGVAVWRAGRLVDAAMPNPSREVNDIAGDRDGGVWVARGGREHDTLARYAGGRWREFGAEDGVPPGPLWQVFPTRDGAVWLVLTDRLAMRPPGAARFQPVSLETTGRANLAEDPAGGLWLSDMRGIRRIAGPGGAVATYSRPAPVGGVRTLVDRSGALWGATWNGGLFRIPSPGRTTVLEGFHAVDGLGSEQTRTVFQDREGSIWVGGELGLDMFRPANVVVEPGIPANSPTSYRLAKASSGVIYVGDASAIYAIAPGQGPRRVLDTNSPVESLCAASRGGVWAALADRLVRVDGGAATVWPKPSGLYAHSCVEDASGRLWLTGLAAGLHVVEAGRASRTSNAHALPGNSALEPSGRAAVAYRQRPTAADPRVTPIFRERFDIGGIEGLFPGQDALFVGGADGLVRIRGRDTLRLSAGAYPWLASVNGLVQTGAGDTWTIGDAGIVQMRTDALERAFATHGPLPHRVFDYRDGLNSFVQKAAGAQAAAGPDGRVWFLTRRNVVWIDPARLVTNPTPPPVLVRAVVAGGRRYEAPRAVELPAGTTTLTVAYTALSLAEPSRVRFRYRLEGVDQNWIEAEGRRSTLYVNLEPGRYRFRVIAANNDGVWNRTGAVVDIHIPPTLIQAWWFRVLLVVTGGVLIWLAIRWRVRAATAAAEARLSERQGERVRIARELHDTLLQGVQGLLVRFQVAANAIPDGEPAKAMMDQVLDRADEILVEGRDRVRDLRAEQDAGSPLMAELERLAYDTERDFGAAVEVSSSGVAEPLNLDVHREIVAIAREALRNAARHAQASAIACSLRFSRRQVRLTCSDNGVGIPPDVLRRGGREGHWGLRGMEERARQIGGTLRVQSGPRGVTILLTVPMRLARQKRVRRGLFHYVS